MKENHLEDACLDWLVSTGWTVIEGEAAAPSWKRRSTAIRTAT